MVRYTKRIYPDEGNSTFQDGGYITYTLPQNIIDKHSIIKYYTAIVDSVESYNDGSFLKRFLPKNSSSVIDELQIMRDGEVIQYIQEYAFLHQMYEDMIDDTFKNTDSDKNETTSYNFINNFNYELKVPDFLNTTTTYSYNYSISKWLGFLNGDRYIDCRGKNVQIKIKLSPKWITYRGLKIIGTSPVNQIYDTNYHYHLSNCYMNMTVIDNENIELHNEQKFDDFSHFKSMKNPSSKNTIVRGKTNKNVKQILTTFTDVNRYSDTGLQLQHHNTDVGRFGSLIKNSYSSTATLLNGVNAGDFTYQTYSPEYAKSLNKPNQLNNSIYFKRNGIDVKTNQFRANGVEISPPYTALESFNNVKKTFDTKLSKVNCLASFINDFFMNVQEYNNQKDEPLTVEWMVVGEDKNVGGDAHMFLIHNKSVNF